MNVTPMTTTPVSALHEILNWSGDRPSWQQDALRRIVAQDKISETDLAELERLCRAPHGADASAEPVLKVNPLAAAHLPPAPGAKSSVSLVSIGNLQHVNRIPSDQVLLFGASPGLTVIYGDNGSGKSGYARVIKKACRTRGATPDILPDALASAPAGIPSASITSHIDDADVPLAWKDGVVADARLANIFVFDASSAGHYLREDGPAIFTPHGLDILPALSKVCDAIRARIQKDIDSAEQAISTTTENWKYSATTQVGRMVDGLSISTTTAEVDALSGVDDTQATRLHDLREALKSDPKQKAKETRAAAARLRAFAETITAAATDLADGKTNALKECVDNAKAAAENAKAFASGQFDATYLTGTGAGLWRKMWNAAREYSTSAAYRDQPFPAIEDDARCVLCQQDLDAAAVQRLRAFDVYCRDESQKLVDQTSKRLKDETERVAQLHDLAPEMQKVEADLASVPEERRVAVADFVKHADLRLAALKKNVSVETWTAPSALPASPEADITAAAKALECRASTEESADDPVTRKKLESERDELEGREWLARVREDVVAQIERHKLVQKLKECQKDASTASITVKSTELTKLLVTKVFRKRFGDEVKDLGLTTLDVRLEEIKGRKGETSFGLRLNTPTDKKVVEIASEGEQRCVALAAFLAELSQASHQSALVFDDPVCSLDHQHQARIAERLARESQTRQVIVFTHDCIFLNDLRAAAERQGTPVHALHLEWSGRSPGYCVEGLPWDWKSPEDRFDKLDKKQREIARTWNPVPNDGNVQAMRAAYSWLRATLERIVEKEIFADVVLRFRGYVDLKNLAEVVGFSQAECDELKRLKKRCDDVTEAHDPPPGRHTVIPTPTELAEDIAAVKALLTTIKDRRKANRASRGALPGTRPAP
ncbi:MAG: AAA family ATPase [Verrucomicrobia bacterium]|nr:AAA family ATPase [Verrucomicrobiota bacterium]